MVVIEANIPANREYATNVISISTSVNGIIYINFEITFEPIKFVIIFVTSLPIPLVILEPPILFLIKSASAPYINNNEP